MVWFNTHIVARIAGFIHISLAFGRQFTFAQIIQLLALVFFAIIVWIVSKFVTSDWTENPLTGVLTDKERSEIVRNAAIILFGVVGTAFAFIRLIYMESQRKTAQSSNRFDRYQKAAAMLAEDSTSVRQAAIYALTAIANEDKKNFTLMVEKLLAGFIRERSVEPMAPHVAEDGVRTHDVVTTDVYDATKALIQISKFNRFERLRDKVPLIDLRRCYFKRMLFENENISGFDFSRANFEHSIFDLTSFENCKFHKSILRDAVIDRATFRRCIFSMTNMNETSINLSAFDECRWVAISSEGATLENVTKDGALIDDDGL